MTINTIFPNDFGFWELIDELVQQEPPEAGDPRLLGLLAAVGIVHGKPFQPDARMRKILEDAVVVGNATARTVTFASDPRKASPITPVRSGRVRSSSVVTSSSIRHPISPQGPGVCPERRARKLNSRTNFFYMATGITPAMCMRLTGIGSQYIYAMRDSEGHTSTVPALPPHAPAGRS